MTVPEILAQRSRLIGLFHGWRAELHTNRRAAAGLLAILTLASGYGIVLLHNAAERMRTACDRELARLERVVAVGAERGWSHRAEASAAIRATLEGRLWVAESEGVARADIQDWVGGIGRDVGLTMNEVRIELAKPPSLPQGVRQITATITAQPSETALIGLLERIDRAPHLILVDRLNVKQLPGPFLEMVLVGYARIGDKDDPAGHAGPK